MNRFEPFGILKRKLAAGGVLIFSLFALVCPAGPAPHAWLLVNPAAARDFGREKRKQMVRVIEAYGLTDPAVLSAMARVPRHEFVPDRLEGQAYADTPLPIGYGQTISQPYIVAEMTRLLHLTRTSRVLEVGTGSGYQAAVLARFTPHVFTMEIIKPLAEAAQKRFERLGITPIEVKRGDGYFGWPEKAPFDGIIVTRRRREIPPPLVGQLKPGGRMVIPVGPVFGIQSLMLVEKDESGKVTTRSVMTVRFVPLTRDRLP